MNADHPHDDLRYPLRKGDEAWRAELDPQQYRAARQIDPWTA